MDSHLDDEARRCARYFRRVGVAAMRDGNPRTAEASRISISIS